MKKIALGFLASIFLSSAFADIPYCSGTDVTGSKHQALQYVIKSFAAQYKCDIGSNCILNFDHVKYSIAWSKNCLDSQRKGNDPKGSTFICKSGTCTPLGFSQPSADY